MDLEIVATGKKIWHIDDGAGKALLEAFPGTYKRIEKPAVNKREVRWVVNNSPANGGVQILCITPLGETIPFQARPEGAIPSYARLGWKVPAEILKQYETGYAKNPRPSYTTDMSKQEQLLHEATTTGLKCDPTPVREPIK